LSLQHALEQQVQRLRYQASLAERQFNQVDPDNRLVAGELERRWEATLSELRRAEHELAERSRASQSRAAIDPSLRGKVVALHGRLADLWAAPATRREHRKALLRCLIEKVVLRRTARDQVMARIVWRGGAASELTIMMPVNGLAALPRQAEMQQRVCELTAQGLYDNDIARTLTAAGHR